MQMYIVQVSYNESIAFTCPEDAARCIEVLLHGQRVNEQSMNGKSAYAVDDTTQLHIKVKQADVYASIQERHDALKEEITFWLNKKKHTVENCSIAISALRGMAGVDKTKTLFRVVPSGLEEIKAPSEYTTVTLKDGEEFVFQA